ncbi:MAG TPA: hypothetical protein DCY94_04050 [Firmicutes bacterium]|nr:hypothetical protein [Bacillota bacterium]
MKNLKMMFVVICTIFSPFVVSAQEAVDPDYDVVASYVSADIDILGSMHVKEAMVVKGELNGFRRTIKYKNSHLADWEPGHVDFANSSIYNARGIKVSKVSALKIDKDNIGWGLLNLNYPAFEEKNSATNGMGEVFTAKLIDDGAEVRAYNVNDGGYMVYYFDYYVNQVAVLHDDCAEVYYTFFILDDDVRDVNIQVTTPGTSKDDVYRIWAHGPLNGDLNAISEEKDEEGRILYKGALAKIQKYKSGEAIDIRMTFDRNLLSSELGILDDSKMEALSGIERIEKERADEANRKRVLIKTVYYITFGGGILYLVGLVILWIYMYAKYDKEHKVNFDMHYYREFTGDYNVEVVDYLMKQDITPDAMNASIMNLIYKKNIDIEEIPDEKKNLILHEKNRDNLNATEMILMELLFDDIGKGKSVTLKEIEKYSSKYSTAEKFMGKYNAWKLSATSDAKKEGFFESLTAPRVCASLYFLLGIILFVLMVSFEVEPFILPISVLLLSIVFLIYVWAFKKWSLKGREDFLKWKAFKNFLLDFGTMDEKEIPAVKLWDRYLVYATVLGVAKEVQKSMKIRLSSMNIEEEMISPSTFYYRDFYIMNSISRSMSTARTKSMSVISAENAKSNMSGGGGFGGGFSGGGGFAGGGGGGGGF